MNPLERQEPEVDIRGKSSLDKVGFSDF